jgi:hypothetical protein
MSPPRRTVVAPAPVPADVAAAAAPVPADVAAVPVDAPLAAAPVAAAPVAAAPVAAAPVVIPIAAPVAAPVVIPVVVQRVAQQGVYRGPPVIDTRPVMPPYVRVKRHMGKNMVTWNIGDSSVTYWYTDTIAMWEYALATNRYGYRTSRRIQYGEGDVSILSDVTIY